MRKGSYMGKTVFVVLALIMSTESAKALSLSEYMDQVKSQNKGQVSANKSAQAASEMAEEADLVFRPNLFAEATTASDGKQATPPLLRYDRIESNKYSLGLSQQFSFGLQGKLYYQMAETQFVNSTLASLGGIEHFYDSNPALELSMPLWGNGFGRTARAKQTALLSGNKAEEYASRAKAKSYEIDAENAYWTLVAMRETLKTQGRALTSAEGILTYLRKKSNMRLGEDNDVLQAEALVASRKLELREAVSNEQAARKEFNLQRNIVSDDIPESLDPIPYQELRKIVVPKDRPSDRFDVKAAEAQANAAAANAKLVAERNKPTLDIYGSYAFNGRGISSSDANSNLYGGDRGTHLVGVRFNMPLDVSSAKQARTGARLAEVAQQEQFSYQKMIQEKDWNLLGQRLQDAKDSLELADKLVVAQKSKLEKEKTRFRQGRTTTYQVLLFEQDQSSAEVIRTRIASQLLMLKSGIRAYETHLGEK